MKKVILLLTAVLVCSCKNTHGSGDFNLEHMIARLGHISSNLTEAVTLYQPYVYDSFRFPMRFIRDGGDDLFDNGNMVRFVENRKRHNLEYNATINTARYNVTTLAINPFIALAAISNPEREATFYTFRVNGDLGADGKGTIDTDSGELINTNRILNYHSFQVYDTGDQSLCEVYFTISSEDFGSVRPSAFKIIQFSKSSRVSTNIVRVTGSPQNIYFGYILLSRGDSAKIPREEIEDVMKLILEASDLELEINRELIPPRQAPRDSAAMRAQTFQESTPASNNFISNNVTSLEVNVPITLDELILRFQQASSDIVNAIDDFYFYAYDTFREPMNFIRDGGNDMFDTGNQVKFVEDDAILHLMYNRTVSTERYNITTRSIYPFVTMAFIENLAEEEHDYRIRVTGDIGADGKGRTSQTEGKLSEGNGFLKFFSFQVYNSGDPTICEVYFTISNTDWGSIAEDVFTISMFSKEPRFLNNEVKLGGRPKNIVFGFTLFSKADGAFITESEIVAAMKIILHSTLSTTIHAKVTLDEISQRANNVRDKVASIFPSFFYYTYDDMIPPNDAIDDGGQDMYDIGNMVKVFPENEEPFEPLEYNTAFEFPTNDVAVDGKGHPFMTLVWIRNEERARSSYSIKVDGNLGADGSGQYVTSKGSLQNSKGTMRYSIFQVFGTRDPSVCEVYFTITREEWESSDNTSFEMINSARMTNAISTRVRLRGTPQNMLMGYTLLSRPNGEKVQDENIEEFLLQLMEEITNDKPEEPAEIQQPGNTTPRLASAALEATSPEQIEQLFTTKPILQSSTPLEHVTSAISVQKQTTSAPTVTNQINVQEAYTDVTKTNSTNSLALEHVTSNIATTSKSQPSLQPPTEATIDEENSVDANESPFAGVSQLLQVFDIIEQNRIRFSQSYPDWYSYRYDGDSNSTIQDGGFDIFDTGNVIKVFENSNKKFEVQYNETYEFHNFDFKSVASDPFIAMLWIKNENMRSLNYTIQVTGNPGADGLGTISHIDGTVTVGNLRIDYKSFQIHGAGDANLCEVYFVISDYDQLMSRRPDEFNLFTSESNLEFVNNSAVISGRSFNLLFGYTLLSRFPSTLIGKLDIESFFISAFDFAPRNEMVSQVVPSTLENISKRSAAIMTSYTDWYTYVYDGNAMMIADGGLDMFDNGNIINVYENGRRVINVMYDQSYSFENFDFRTQTGKPFVALLWVKNEQLQLLSYSIQVQSDTGADGGGAVSVFDDVLTFGDTYIDYHVFQITEAMDATICELYFALQNLSDFEANAYDTFEFTQSGRGTSRTNNSVTVTGRPSRILLGYMLLSRHPSSLITNEEIRRVLRAAFDPEYEPPLTIPAPSAESTTTRVRTASSTTEKPTTADLATTRTITEAISKEATTTPTLEETTPVTTQPASTEHNTTKVSPVRPTAITDETTRPVITSQPRTPRDEINTLMKSIPSDTRPGDLDFLPSCTVRGAVLSVFRCERLFQQRSVYTGPESCRNKIDEIIRCVGKQLVECRSGASGNVLDEHNLLMFNSKNMISTLYNITMQSMIQPNFEINTFCFHSVFNLPYPHRVQGNVPGCAGGLMDTLLDRIKELYYRYVWARNKHDICRAFRSFKNWFRGAASRNCRFEDLYQLYSSTTATYLDHVARIALKTIEDMDISACKESSDSFALDRPDLFTKWTSLPCESP